MNQPQSLKFSPKFSHRLFLGLLILVTLAIIGISWRIIAYGKLKREVKWNNVPFVALTTAAPSPATEDIILPGNVQAWHSTTIFARTNGYTIHWLVDIGAHVKAGELLATIASPEIDEQLRQTEANLKNAQVNNALAQRTAVRWQNLLKTASVSKQETDDKVSAAKATAAIVIATRANRDRLRQLVNFERVVAPFEGIITSRTVDIGRLINAGSVSTAPLFSIAQANPLRVYVRVPEYYSSRIQPGMTVELYFREHPEKTYPAKLLNTAEAIDATTRTLLVQFAVDNTNYELFPGSYSEVHLKIPGSPTAVHLPVNTLIFRAQGMQVATVDANSTAVFKSITIGRDFGDTVEIVAGLNPGEKIILNPPSTLISGEKIHVATQNK